VSAIGLIWSASKGTRALRRGLNRVYDVEENRSFLVLYLIYIGYTLAMLVMLALMLFLVFVDPVSSFLAEKMPEVFNEPVQSALSEMFLIPLFEVLAVTLLYTTLPSGKRKFVRQLPGGILVTVIWFVFSYLFSLYVNSKSNTQTAVYGVLGTVGIFLLWLFCCFYILLIGAYFNRFFWEQKNRVWLYFRQLKKEHQKGKE
jgi:membrane protein